MARNLVKAKEEEQEEEIKETVEVPKQEVKEEVKVITFEALIANNLDALNNKVDRLEAILLEGFKQVGVKFQ